jgi:hypothetical protein
MLPTFQHAIDVQTEGWGSDRVTGIQSYAKLGTAGKHTASLAHHPDTDLACRLGYKPVDNIDHQTTRGIFAITYVKEATAVLLLRASAVVTATVL